jgi:hypothetical protein
MGRPCNCDGGGVRRPLYDARSIFVAYVCDACEPDVRARYRPDIFTDPNYWTDEEVDGDDWL